MMEVRPELITELSERFYKKLKEQGSADPAFHPADIARVEKRSWLRRFLEHNDCNVDEALNMLWETCIWRKKFGANTITEDVVKKEYLEDGLCFIHGKDKDGKTMFVIRCKLHTKKGKDYEELQKVVVYWFERLERFTNGDQISLFFDMADTGISNLDMNFIEYLTGLCKNYYPNFLNYIIIFEMPWILEAAFKVIKSWLPPKAIPKIKFVQKNNIHEYVTQSDILVPWGGTNEYTFKFVTETFNNTDATVNGKVGNKKVYFAEGSPLVEQPPSNFDEQGNEEEMLSVEPKIIAFCRTGNETAGTIKLKNNTSDKPLCYKVKITSPEKFRVRSSSGVILPLKKQVVSIVLQPGYNLRSLVNNDRFLVVCIPLKDPNATPQEMAALWKSEIKPEEHKLGCCDGDADINDKQKSYSLVSSGMSENRTLETLFHNVAQLKDSNAKLQSDVSYLKHLLLFSIIVTIVTSVLVVYILRIDIKNGTMDDEDCHIPHV